MHTHRPVDPVQLVRSCPCMQGNPNANASAGERRPVRPVEIGGHMVLPVTATVKKVAGLTEKECNACMHRPMRAAGETSGRPGRRQTAERTRRDRTNDGPTAHGPAGGARAAGSWRNDRPMWRCTYVISSRSIHRRPPPGDLAPNRPVGMQKSEAQRANRTTKPPRAAAHGSIDRSATADS
jgi:hypothetical protein